MKGTNTYRMMKLMLITLMVLLTSVSKGQGCSDAGACSSGSLGLESSYATGRGDLTLGYTQRFGLADKQSLVAVSEISLAHRVFHATEIEFRWPFQLTAGNLGTTTGLGDPIITVSQEFVHSKKILVSLVAGGRLKSNDADKKAGEKPLPMVYQTSLGTYDLFAGMSLRHRNWSASMAWQHPFGANQNEYLHPDSLELPDNKRYFESAYLDRGDDIMVRIQRTETLNDKNTLMYGVLPIWRIQQDQIKRKEVYESLGGSGGITFNLFLFWQYQLDKVTSFNLSTGFPVHARDYRADGLTRTLVLSAGIMLRFSQGDKLQEGEHNFYDLR